MLTKHDTGHAATVVTGWTESSDVQWLAAGTATGKVSECRYAVTTGYNWLPFLRRLVFC